MTQAEQKERARRFLENFNQADRKIFAELITPNFTFAIMSALEEFPPVSGRDNFAQAESAALRRLFPNGLGLKLDMILSDGPHVVAVGDRCASRILSSRAGERREPCRRIYAKRF